MVPGSKHDRGTETTLRRVDVAERRWAAYRGLAQDALVEEAAELGADVRGARVLHVNATAYGGGVAELLASEIGLLRDLGVDAEWRVVCPDAAFFRVTKQMHNAMQGKEAGLSDKDRALYLERNKHCAEMLADEWNVIVIHDPQPAALRAWSRAQSARWIWRCHIDTSTPDQDTWAFLEPHIASYDEYVFTLESFAPEGLSKDRLAVIAPAIDPLSTKNRQLPRFIARSTVAATGVELERPLMVQVSRFDPWKDPLGVIDAWRIAREHVRGLQLALVGAMAEDDPRDGGSTRWPARRQCPSPTATCSRTRPVSDPWR